MNRPDLDAEIAKLRLTWRRVTREWLIARRDVAELQDQKMVDLPQAISAARRLEQAERNRANVAHQLQQLYDRAEDRAEAVSKMVSVERHRQEAGPTDRARRGSSSPWDRVRA